MITDLISSVLDTQSGGVFRRQGQYEETDIVVFEQAHHQVIFNLAAQCLWCNDPALMSSLLNKLNQRLPDGYFEMSKTSDVAYWKRDFSVGI